MKICRMVFASVYPLYVQKAERRGRTKEEVDRVIFWLTGYHQESLEHVLEEKWDMQTFFERAPDFNPKASLIKGVVCGVRVEAVEDPLMQKVRYLDKLIDELAAGKALEKVLRQ